MPKISRSPIVDKVKAEMRHRILLDVFRLDEEQGCQLIEYLEEINYNDRVIVMYALTSVSNHLENLTHLQLFRLVMMAIKINKISYPFAKTFLDLMNEFDREKIVEMFNTFDHPTATNYIFTLSSLQSLLSKETFHSHLRDGVLDMIINAVIITF